ncbi:HAD family hydrolase [Lentzea sp. NPDC004789]
MTNESTPCDEPAILARLLSDADVLLLDFDGPVCSVFAGFPAPVVADQLRDVLKDGWDLELPPRIAKEDDPFEVFRYAATLGEDHGRFVEAALTAHEVEAVATAEPTPWAHDLVRAWHRSGRLAAIVSNNSSRAVETYLGRHDLAGCIAYVSGRRAPDPRLLKPHPHLMHEVLTGLRVGAAQCLLVGDSDTDVIAASASSVPVIGYANKPAKIAILSSAHPELVVTEFHQSAMNWLAQHA